MKNLLIDNNTHALHGTGQRICPLVALGREAASDTLENKFVSIFRLLPPVSCFRTNVPSVTSSVITAGRPRYARLPGRPIVPAPDFPPPPKKILEKDRDIS